MDREGHTICQDKFVLAHLADYVSVYLPKKWIDMMLKVRLNIFFRDLMTSGPPLTAENHVRLNIVIHRKYCHPLHLISEEPFTLIMNKVGVHRRPKTKISERLQIVICSTKQET